MKKKVSCWRQIGRFVFLLVLVNIIGLVASGYMTQDTLNWYHSLNNSSLTPSDWIFGAVWSILFFLMALSAWLVWGRARLKWFYLQLFANMWWSFSFFYLRSIWCALFVLLFLILALIMNIRDFYRVSKISGWLLVPTLLWSLFALYLNVFLLT